MRASYRLFSGDIGKLRLECGLRVGVGASSQEIVVRITNGSRVLVGLELVRIIPQQGLLTREEVIRGGFGGRVLDIGLHWVTSQYRMTR